MTSRSLSIGVLAAGAALAGCHRPAQPVEATVRQVYLADAGGYDRVWESCQEVLRHHRFELDRVDRRGGTITTYPVTSQSLFEFWRHDVDTSFDLMESTLRTVRREATVQIATDPDDPNDPAARLVVTVQRSTLASPERQFNGSSSALRVFGEELPGVQGEPYLSRTDNYWIDDGRDGAMERRLLERIIERAGISAPETVILEPPATESSTG
ncbi:MAG: hypothetical protein GY778_31855 [bacterium]|nr:hypothetical protein [bacterium]